MNARLVGVSTVLPPHRFTQDDACGILRDWLADSTDAQISFDRAVEIFRNSGVATRYSVLPIRELLLDPPLGEKNRLYIEHATNLAMSALRRLFDETGAAASEVDLLVTVSCTGFAIPAIDARILERIGFRPDVRRIPVTALGCAAGAAGIRIADDFLRGVPRGTAVVLAVETPTLTFQPTDRTADHIVSCAIFGDGAAAALLRGGESERAAPGLEIGASTTRFFPASLDLMGYDLEATGFHIYLSSRIPRFVREEVAPTVAAFLGSEGVAPAEIDSWIVHPGGPKILDVIEDALDLARGGLTLSRPALRDHGNLSSATVLFMLAEAFRLARENPPAEGAPALLAAVGPGFGVDLSLLAWRGVRHSGNASGFLRSRRRRSRSRSAMKAGGIYSPITAAP